MKKIFIVFLLFASCAIVEVKQSHYKREIPKIPTKEITGIEDVGAIAVGATEINKGMAKIYFQGVDALDEKVKILWDFSYNVMGFLGVAWESIDWDNPEKWLDQVKQKQQAMETALKNEKESNIKLEKDLGEFKDKLAKTEKAVEDKAGELAANDGKWSAKFSWWFKLFLWIIILLLIVGFGWYAYGVIVRMIAGFPFKAALWGEKLVRKTAGQMISSVQNARLELKEKIRANGDKVKGEAFNEAWKIIHKHLEGIHDEDVKEAIESVKSKKHLKSTDDI